MHALNDLLLQGPVSAPELRGQLGVSQATFSRLTRADARVIQFGKARATRYALNRPIKGIATFPLWRVNEQGRAYKFGDVYPCWPQGSCLVKDAEGGWEWFDGLPWYLADLRPQGFLGRAWGRRFAQQYALPDDIRLWQESDVLYALSRFTGENFGGWLVGEENYQRWFASAEPEVIQEDEKQQKYEQLSQEALAGEIVGSSAGGEQPKFVCIAPTPVLVKFTAPQITPVSERWCDLLFAEAIALGILAQEGIPAAEATALQGEKGQVFLQVARFDCVGIAGRRAIVSLEATQSEFISATSSWPLAVAKLVNAGVVAPETVAHIERIWAFGRLIGNSDMHVGNLSFYYSRLPLELAPVYDMLPMALAPTGQGVIRQEPCELRFDAGLSRQAWEFALPLAYRFWESLQADVRISAGFRHIASGMIARLDEIRVMVKKMA